MSEVSASPSGSVAVTVKLIGVKFGLDTTAGAVTTGARLTPPMEIVVAADPDKAFEAVNVTVYVPACVKLGVQLNVPEVLPAPAVNVLPVVAGELEDVNEEIGLPSGSDALTTIDPGTPAWKAAVAGAVTTGARSPPEKTLSAVWADPDNAFEAVNVTL